MIHYRVYLVGSDGHFETAIDLLCNCDAHAIERTRQLVDGHDLELWQGIRQIARFAALERRISSTVHRPASAIRLN
jgi:hypothetical protein